MVLAESMDELELYVEKCGMSITEALNSATALTTRDLASVTVEK